MCVRLGYFNDKGDNLLKNCIDLTKHIMYISTRTCTSSFSLFCKLSALTNSLACNLILFVWS